jgi:hypothetical protein
MKIHIKHVKNYGLGVYYPVCDKAKLLAELCGTKTLTPAALATIIKMGFDVTVDSEAPALEQAIYQAAAQLRQGNTLSQLDTHA